MQDWSPRGFMAPYTGSDGSPFAFGINLLKFNAFGNFLTSKIPQNVTQAQKDELKDLVDNLEDEIKLMIEKLGEPQLFVLWSTS